MSRHGAALIVLGTVIADTTLAVANLTDTGILGTNPWSRVVAAISLVALCMLAVGWAYGQVTCVAQGFAVSAGVWAAMAILYATMIGWSTPTVWLAIGWAIVGSGAYLVARELVHGAT